MRFLGPLRGYALHAELNVPGAERLLLANQLRKGIEREELLLLNQPQRHTATNRLIGEEALVRWNHPKRGLLSPDRFIAVAEGSDLILVSWGDGSSMPAVAR